MRGEPDLRGWARRRWRLHWTKWLVTEECQSWNLQPPTQAQLLADPDQVAAWVREWQLLARKPGIDVSWVTRRWASAGNQRLPERVTLNPAAMAELAGESLAWQRARQAADLLVEQWPQVELDSAVTAMANQLARLSEQDAVRLVAVLAWLQTHQESGLWEREIPVVDVDTKWVERHRSLVDSLVQAITGTVSGLRRAGIRFRVRLLDERIGQFPADFVVDLAELAKLELRPDRVLICENLTSVATLPALAGTVAVHGMGLAAPGLAEVGWIADAHVRYWGDLDSYGLLILGRMRQVLPNVQSVLMDEQTFLAHQQLAVAEPRPFRGVIGHLTLTELAALALIRQGDRRLEQERIPRDEVFRVLTSSG